MRHFKRKLHIIWMLLFDNYTNSDTQGKWWLWDNKTTISFEPEPPKE